MSEQADIKPTSRLSKVWLIPILAIIIGGWMVFYQWQNQGPLITIELKSASGIEVNKTPIKVRDLEVGQVKKIELRRDLEGVVVTARIDDNAAYLLTENTDFWVVAPRITFSEVSGLNTLLSGSYIAMSADDSGKSKRHFVALERPPVTPPGTPGLHVILKSDDKFAYKPGDPIIYKGFKVGEFENAEFNIEDRVVYYEAFIKAPYHRLVTENTRFWNVSGVSFNLESSGVKIETGSLETLLANGITFGIPDGIDPGEPAGQNSRFTIFQNNTTASNARFKLAVEYLLMIDESVRGLKVGAPVEYRGIEIGEVVSINAVDTINGTILDEGYPIPVVINIYPGKVRQEDNKEGLEFVKSTLRKWISRDLRASLRMGNVLTGGLYVDLRHVRGAEAVASRAVNGYEVIPTVSNEFTQLTQKADAILDKINELPLDALIGDVQSVIGELKDAALSVKTTSGNFDTLVTGFDGEQINANVNRMLVTLNQLLKNYSEGGLSQNEIQETVDAMQDTLRGLQPLLQQLNQRPNGLIFSGASSEEVIPKAKGNNNE